MRYVRLGIITATSAAAAPLDGVRRSKSSCLLGGKDEVILESGMDNENTSKRDKKRFG